MRRFAPNPRRLAIVAGWLFRRGWPGVSRRLAASLLIVVFLGSASVASAATRNSRYRTDKQAEAYLEHSLKTWMHVDLRNATHKSAFCVSSAAQRSRRPVRKIRSFSCVLNVKVGKTYVFVIHLLWTRTGWRAKPLRS